MVPEITQLNLEKFNPIQKQIVNICQDLAGWAELPLERLVEIKPEEGKLSLHPINRYFGAETEQLINKTAINASNNKANLELLPIFSAMQGGMQGKQLKAGEKDNVTAAIEVLTALEKHQYDDELSFINGHIKEILRFIPTAENDSRQPIDLIQRREGEEIQFNPLLNLKTKALLIQSARSYQENPNMFPGDRPDFTKDLWKVWATKILIPIRINLENCTGREAIYTNGWEEAIKTLPWSKRERQKLYKQQGEGHAGASKKRRRKKARRKQVGPQTKK